MENYWVTSTEKTGVCQVFAESAYYPHSEDGNKLGQLEAKLKNDLAKKYGQGVASKPYMTWATGLPNDIESIEIGVVDARLPGFDKLILIYSFRNVNECQIALEHHYANTL
jgi:hypothetical protein